MRQSRLKLVLGKYRVTKLKRNLGHMTFNLDLGGPQMQIKLNVDADVREGDLLTIYTEVLHAPAN